MVDQLFEVDSKKRNRREKEQFESELEEEGKSLASGSNKSVSSSQ